MTIKGGHGRFQHPVALGDGLYLAQPENGYGRPAALTFLADGNDVLLLGIPQGDPWSAISMIQAAGFGVPTHLLVLEWDDRLIDILNTYAGYAPDASVIAVRRVAEAFGSSVHLQVHNLQGTAAFTLPSSRRTIDLVSSPFVFSPTALMAYDRTSRTLFSNRLFEIPWDRPAADTPEATLSGIHDFCRAMAPSSDYLRPVLSAVMKLDLGRVITRSGALHDAPSVAAYVADLAAIEFYNASRVGGDASVVREFSHAALSTQVLFRLAAAFSREEVLGLFTGAELSIAPDTFEFTGGIDDDFRLWQRLFDLIYAKRGASWLAVAEPLVDKLVALYGVVKPAVYRSGIAAAEKTVTNLDVAKKELEEQYAHLEARLLATQEKLSRDPLTGFYNEPFLRAFLSGAIANARNEAVAIDRGLLFVAIDDVARLTKRYAKSSANEAIRNFGYLLDRLRAPADIVARRQGVGYVVTLTDCQTAGNFLERVRGEVSEAGAFLEPLTISAALVRLRERPKNESPDETVAAMLLTGEERLLAALDHGPSAFVDTSVETVGIRYGRVLLVDDDPVALDLFGTLLRSRNYEVTTAMDGAAALEASLARRFDFILCERNVPKLDAFALRQKLHAAPGSAPSLFILTTYNKTRETVMRANLADIDVVLGKPLIFEEIDGILRRVAKKAGIYR